MGPLTLSTSTLAQDYAEEMLATKIFRHNPSLPNGVGENVGMMRYYSVYYNLTSAIDRLEYLMMYEDEAWDWGHRENILNPDFRQVSLGMAYDGEYLFFVQNFYR